MSCLSFVTTTRLQKVRVVTQKHDFDPKSYPETTSTIVGSSPQWQPSFTSITLIKSRTCESHIPLSMGVVGVSERYKRVPPWNGGCDSGPRGASDASGLTEGAGPPLGPKVVYVFHGNDSFPQSRCYESQPSLLIRVVTQLMLRGPPFLLRISPPGLRLVH